MHHEHEARCAPMARLCYRSLMQGYWRAVTAWSCRCTATLIEGSGRPLDTHNNMKSAVQAPAEARPTY
jgi:hypothetical protein